MIQLTVGNIDIEPQNSDKLLLKYLQMYLISTKMTNKVENIQLEIEIWKPCFFFCSFGWAVTIVERMPPSNNNTVILSSCNNNGRL